MSNSPVVVEPCDLPELTLLRVRYPDFVRFAYFRDAYRTRLTSTSASPVEIFQSVFAHRPTWLKIVLMARNSLALLIGLDAPTVSEIMKPEMKSHYAVGEKIGPWPIFVLTDTELVAGRDNKHLDFRLSVSRETDGETASTVISTVCRVHNAFGKVCLFFIIPFHKWGVRRLIMSAALAGRL